MGNRILHPLTCVHGCIHLYWTQDTVSKIVSVWWPVFTFTAIGFEHSIANMFYVGMCTPHLPVLLSFFRSHMWRQAQRETCDRGCVPLLVNVTWENLTICPCRSTR